MSEETKKAAKPRVAAHLKFFARALYAVVEVMEYGSKKPGRYPGSWLEQSQDREDYFADAMLRHWLDAQIGGPQDGESPYTHLAHRACNALMELETAIRNREKHNEPTVVDCSSGESTFLNLWVHNYGGTE